MCPISSTQEATSNFLGGGSLPKWGEGHANNDFVFLSRFLGTEVFLSFTLGFPGTEKLGLLTTQDRGSALRTERRSLPKGNFREKSSGGRWGVFLQPGFLAPLRGPGGLHERATDALPPVISR